MTSGYSRRRILCPFRGPACLRPGEGSLSGARSLPRAPAPSLPSRCSIRCGSAYFPDEGLWQQSVFEAPRDSDPSAAKVDYFNLKNFSDPSLCYDLSIERLERKVISGRGPFPA